MRDDLVVFRVPLGAVVRVFLTETPQSDIISPWQSYMSISITFICYLSIAAFFDGYLGSLLETQMWQDEWPEAQAQLWALFMKVSTKVEEQKVTRGAWFVAKDATDAQLKLTLDFIADLADEVAHMLGYGHNMPCGKPAPWAITVVKLLRAYNERVNALRTGPKWKDYELGVKHLGRSFLSAGKGKEGGLIQAFWTAGTELFLDSGCYWSALEGERLMLEF